MKQNNWQSRAEWLRIRQHLRSEVSRVLRDIETGLVNETDFAKLNNFCMTALTLLSKIQEPTWRASERDTELAAMLRNEVVDDDVEKQVSEYQVHVP